MTAIALAKSTPTASRQGSIAMTLKEQLLNSLAVTPVHAELSASTAERWWHCPGSIRMIRLQPFTPPASIYALRGTAMHAAAAQWLDNGQEPQWALQQFYGDPAHPFDLEEDEIEAVEMYVRTVWDDQRTFGGDLLIEHRFSLASLREGMFGTNDAMLLNCPDRVLRVYDFKGGKGIPVDVEWNFQELYYAYGAVLTVPRQTIDTIELCIVQPRCRHPQGPVRRWRIDIIDAFDWSHDLLKAAERTDDPNAPLQAGEWCKFCPAAGSCKEYERYALHSAQLDFSVIEPGEGQLPDPKRMTPEELAKLLPMLRILEEWASLVYSHAHAEAEAGRVPPGHKLVAKRGKRQWTISEPEVVSIFGQLGLKDHDIFKRELRSPAQIEKPLRKPDRPVVNKVAAMMSSGTNLVPFDDPRPAVEGTGLAVFAPIPGGHPKDEDAPP
jgi:hypothetical protein